MINNTSGNCSLYLAPSTIPNAGLGIFTSVARGVGEALGYPDIAIPIIDLTRHQPHMNEEGSTAWILDDYVWLGEHFGMGQESPFSESVFAYAPGMNCAINSHLALVNAQKGWTDTKNKKNDEINNTFDYKILPHRGDSANAGSMTPYMVESTHATAPISPGGEIFKSYGDNWFSSRPEYFGDSFPLSQNYPQAQRLALRFVHLLKFRWTSLSELAQRDLYRIIRSTWNGKSRTINALPSTIANVIRLAINGTRSLYEPNATRPDVASMPQARCIDNMYPGPSKILHAGRGAFASRFLAKNQIISGSPLVHITDRYLLEIYHHSDDDDDVMMEDLDNADIQRRRRRRTVKTLQLLLNYCWGHSETTLLLCPYGAGVNLINHNSKPNVKIQWSPDGHVGHDNQLVTHKRVSDLRRVNKPQLSWDYVALRDIKEGEELYIDYGEEWEQAWQRHLNSWKRTKGDENYKSAAQLNQEETMLKTKTEGSYPSNVLMQCSNRLRYESMASGDMEMRQEELLEEIIAQGIPCHVTNRTQIGNDQVYKYTVQLSWGKNKKKKSFDAIDRNLIAFIDRPYSTDIHMQGTFRQPAMIPLDMLPLQWKNKPKNVFISGTGQLSTP